MLNLQIHVLDYLQWLLGEPEYVCSIQNSNSGLKVDVEDVASSLFGFKLHDGRIIPVYSHTDFLQFPPEHKLKIVGSKGRVEADINKAITTFYIGDEKKVVQYDGFKRNDMFIKELEDFMDCVKNRKQPEISIEQGIVSLKMAIASKVSAKENRIVKLEEF